ncbi:FKBP-type peptidyl-prolyl cis-trans isomerase [Pedobacter psychroterrae]|uniref:Peptidyl-prolyl cis-trans isomerase n=1 Tax=Pedobacter psychroterrae TaxID=2530453 RepID=A0A4V2MLX2_9SPHI|nr:FKBP-type peptidyl-prolyl cis-trans isomerase [Pedobacter psychroterrae]TCD03607.1 FKBP-type peptidyl-prolyl cis-trans isomerase [Pedobacter psychroterrae]
MKKIIITFLLPLCAFTAMSQTKKTTTAAKKVTPVKTAVKAGTQPIFKSNLDSASYALGAKMASGMKQDGLTLLNYDLLVRGFKDAFAGSAFSIPEEKFKQAIGDLFNKVTQQKYAPAIAEGKSFLEKNKTQTGVQTTPSGLQYLVLTKGTGIKPAASDTVLVHYKGTLLNGTEFDSSYKRDQPLSLPLNNVIPGWTEGVQLMSTGSKYKFFIPYNLAYGEGGQGEIPPYSTLVFEIELLKVNGK